MSADPQNAFLAHAYFITREGQGKLALQLLWKKKKVETNSRRMAGDKIACHYYENRINIQKALETAPLLYEKRKKKLKLKYLPHFSITTGVNYINLMSLRCPRKNSKRSRSNRACNCCKMREALLQWSNCYTP
jgi:hypothetical protein